MVFWTGWQWLKELLDSVYALKVETTVFTDGLDIVRGRKV